MRLALCNATRRWGGVKTWTIEFADALKGMGHSPVLYGRDPSFVERAAARGLEAVRVSFGCDFSPLSTGYFFREFKKRDTQAVLVNVSKDLRTAGLAARLLGLPVVQRIGLPRDMEDSFSARLSHRLIRPHYLCPCRYIRDGMLEALPFVAGAETSVIYSAKTPLPHPPEAVKSPLRLVSSSQVNANKGHMELAHTLARLMREGHDFHWDVAGTGDCLDALRVLCSALGLDGRVTFHGFMQNLPALLETSDVFILSSYREGLPNTLLEAMAAGLVPVGRSVGGVAECWPAALPFLLVPYGGWEQEADWGVRVEEGVTALPLYPPLKRVFTAPGADVSAWKRATWEHCREHFSLEVQARRLECFFQELINVD